MDPRAKPPKELLTISGKGFGLRFAVEGHTEVTTRSGRKYARPAKEDEMVDVVPVGAKDVIVAATRRSYVLSCKAEEVNKLEGPGKGVIVVKTEPEDRVIGFVSGTGRSDCLELITTSGTRKFSVAVDGRRVTARGGKGKQLVKRSQLKMQPKTVTVPNFDEN